MILEIDNIELNYDTKKILSAVYFKAENGKITGILGRNGCGKTSLLRILFGNLSPKYKNIRIDGKHQKNSLFKSAQIAFLPQHQLVPNNLSLQKICKISSVSWDDFILEFPSFKKYKKSKTKELSSGEIRVFETYLILASGKKIILLDEPFSFIAPLFVEKFKKIIDLKKENCIIILTDHFYREILDLSDTVYFLKNGYSKKITSKEELESEGYI